MDDNFALAGGAVGLALGLRGKKQKQIPYGDDNQKDNSNCKRKDNGN
jgi:hypothetical protein